ncbi:glutathione hydrolase 6 isoform X3 [Neomonachus schauinslandi]|uniref:Glutathione hydrolase 6 isoform X3 n=1 Tax=Neomonachus schauinslandi TaxID=29088 RepID=A0A8M1MW30_NEOSC|nr:glutathione hydrolase 6 isoform X3 [Neomonachus schauinslandi]
MEPPAGPVLYQKLLLWDPSLGSEDDEEEETSELVAPDTQRPHDSLGNKFGGLPGVWARLGAALLLLAVAFSLAARQLYTGGDPMASLGSAAARPGGHPHHPGVYHHGAIVSPAGQKLLAAGGNVVDAGVGGALCLAVVHPHATGLGAMFWGLFYNSTSRSSTALTSGPAQTLGPGLGLPTALSTLRLLHTHFGHLPWPRLLVGPATLAREGFLVDTALAAALAARGTKGLCPLLCHADGTPLGPGARATNPKLAAVLLRAALAPTPELAGDALLSLLVRDLGLQGPSSGPTPALEAALQLAVPQGILSTTPSPSAGPELLTVLKAALRSGGPSPDPCPAPLQAPVTPVGSVLATIDSSGSVLLLASSLNSSFGSGHLSPSTGVLLSNLVAKPTASAWACPLILHGSADDTEADVLGLVASGTPAAARVMTHALLSHLAVPQTQAQPQHQQGPTPSTSVCGQGILLQVAAQAEHAHVSSVPSSCCTFQGF